MPRIHSATRKGGAIRQCVYEKKSCTMLGLFVKLWYNVFVGSGSLQSARQHHSVYVLNQLTLIRSLFIQ